jgi:uncharacterized protein YqeY
MLESVNNAITAALKSGDKATAEALRLLKSSLMYAKIAAGHELTDAESVKVVQKEIKARIEARDVFAANDRPELAKKEEFERSVYAPYAPAGLSSDEIDRIITEQAAKLEAGYSFALLMPKVMQAIAGKADGREVSEKVKQFIGEAN